VRFDNIQRFAQKYDRLRANSPRAELEGVGRFLRSRQHAYRGHRDSVAAIVASLFKQTPPGGVEMLYINETVFGVRDGAPLMDRRHPCLHSVDSPAVTKISLLEYFHNFFLDYYLCPLKFVSSDGLHL
jgi:hypothetical protein